MIAHPPNLTGPDYGVVAAKRRVLKLLIARLHVTPEGCITHPGMANTHPSVMWPNREGYFNGKAKYRVEGNKPTNAVPVKKTPTHRLILELWFPGLKVPGSTSPVCGVRRCVNPQHRVPAITGAVLLGEQIGWAKKLTVEEAREICYLRLTHTAFYTHTIAEKFGITMSQVNKIAKGENWAKHTEDIRAKYEFCFRRQPMSKYREVCQLRLDNPDMDNKAISTLTGVDQNWVSKVLNGKKYGDYTADIRSQRGFIASPPRHRKVHGNA